MASSQTTIVVEKESSTDPKFFFSAKSDIFLTPSSSTGSLNGMFCRICHLSDGDLIKPCRCAGSIGHVHKKCLETWVKLSECVHCQVCQTRYARTFPRLKPFREWERPTWSLMIGVVLVLTLLAYHVYALHHSCTNRTINTTHLVVYISMLTVDQVVLLGMLMVYLSGQTVQAFTDRKAQKRDKRKASKETLPKV
ncbi:unnamed protein product [Bursaphelenchus xylophilus]|uniref:(pine wood nematode) hypothetical protein n=1 Tax=Bursaphelenchus xylophilus TaxID=6326 RepID=A0A1I7S8L1_BURXY|nr:unnamed protein product [Bursaphelenchus xylophilus]CAG9089548.1 unnamed protein product [Bursaphelenchus xylophilus]